jgi:hypothetical protein
MAGRKNMLLFYNAKTNQDIPIGILISAKNIFIFSAKKISCVGYHALTNLS